MEELEIKPEGEVPQAPEGDAVQDVQSHAPDELKAAGAEQLDADNATDGEAAPVTHKAADVEAEPAGQDPEPAQTAAVDPETAVDPEAVQESPAGNTEEPTDSEDASPIAIDDREAPAPVAMDDAQLMAVLEAVIYVAEEPLTLAQISAALGQPADHVDTVLRQLIAQLENPGHGITIREIAGGFKMATKPEHHEAVRNFVKSLKPPMKLSLPALETLAVIAYKQPVTAPEIMEVRGVQGTGVLKTLLDRKLIAVAGRKNVIGKPILYKTTKDFLIQFGLNDVNELPSLKEFEDIRRMAFADNEVATPEAGAPPAEEAAPSESEPATQEQES